MNLKNSTFSKSRYFFLFFIIFAFSCEDDTREVTLFDKGVTEANASSTNIRFGETVSFTSTSKKALTTTWSFQGGSPASSINPNVTIFYNTPGTYEAKLTVKYIDNSIENKIFTIIVKGIDPQLPFGGTAVAIPGTIEAENYDLGGEGVAYHDTEEENLAVTNGSATYRSDDGPDINVGAVTSIGHTNDGEWANYTITVANTGIYDFDFKVSSASPTGGTSIRVQSMNQATGVVSNLGETGNFPNTGGADVFISKKIIGLPLTEGSNTIRLHYTGANTNLDKIDVIVSVPAPPINGLKVFSERAIIASNLGQPPVNNGNFVITTVNTGAYEGTSAYLYKVDPVNSGNTVAGFALSVMAPATSPLNAVPYNYYNIALKTTSTNNLRVRMNTTAGNYWITLNAATTDAAYGMVRDGNWHSLKIPMTDFKRDGNGPDITPNKDKIVACLVLRTDDADYANYSGTPGAFQWYVDDIYYSVD